VQKLQYRGQRNSVKNGLNKLDCPRKLAYVGFHVNYRETEGLVSYKKASYDKTLDFSLRQRDHRAQWPQFVLERCPA